MDINKEFDEKFQALYLVAEEEVINDVVKQIKQFINQKLKERDDKWKEVIMYNTDIKTWEKIKNAIWVLDKPVK